MAAVTLLSILPTERGALTQNWIMLLWFGVGWGMYLTPLILGAVGLALILEALGRDLHMHLGKLAALLLLYLLILTSLALLVPPDPAVALSPELVDMGGGGYLGRLLGALFMGAVGDVGAYVLVFLLAFVVLCVLVGLTPIELVAIVGAAWRDLREWYRIRFQLMPNNDAARLGMDSAFTPPLRGNVSEIAPAVPSAVRSGAAPEAEPPEAGSPQPRTTADTAGEVQWRLPPLEDILETSTEHEISQAEIRTRVRIIEETLASFGVPARVVEVNQGPAVTQFGVEPGFLEQKMSTGRIKRSKVKVSKISNLANDLALALAASPVRIEAPVPGRSVVGIEVPNMDTSVVSLRSVMDTEAFQRVKSKLRIALGQDVSGQPAVADLAAMPHLLIAGATGSGKSVCINSVVACLLCQNTPNDLRLIMIDPKMVELSNYNGIPHLLEPVVVELERVVEVLRWTAQEMDRRYKLFAKVGARNLEAYNAGSRGRDEASLPKIIVIIDELADLMMVAADQVERHICRIAQMARATGIHLVIATQRPSVDVITGLIKANFPARVSFAVSSQIDSRVILDTAGAERLLGQGDMLFMRPDSSKLARLQGCFVSDSEINSLVRYWKGLQPLGRSFLADGRQPQSAVQRPLWDDLIAQDKDTIEEDDLLDKAIETVRQHERASTSLLQRRLRIGYSRAARLIDILEERGIIGPDPGGGRSREVLEKDDGLSQTLQDESGQT
jgi:S-DNA-T family DNA segregation ATPase FtsK/SpoIIIE